MCKFLSSHSGEWLKRQAAQIASQLPESRADALVVLAMAREIIIKLNIPVEGDERQDAHCGAAPDCARQRLKLVSSDPE